MVGVHFAQNKMINIIDVAKGYGFKGMTSRWHTKNLADKSITPMGGFPLNGKVKQDFVLFKGCCIGPKERVLALGERLVTHTKKKAFIWGKLQVYRHR